MPVKNIECQLAELQIGRYVSGEALSAEALKQIEAHVSKCSNCAQVLQDRKAALTSMLSHGVAAVTTDIPAKKENPLLKAIREKGYMQETRETRVEREPRHESRVEVVTTPTEKPATSLKLDKFGKPAMYSAGLAAVLIGMSFFGRAQNSIFGGSADRAFPESTPAVTKTTTISNASLTTHINNTSNEKTPLKSGGVASPVSKAAKKKEATKISTPVPASTPPAGTDSSDPKDDAVENAATSTGQENLSTPPKTHKQPRHAPAIRPRIKSKTAANRVSLAKPAHRTLHKPAASVRVYDESGNPLGK